MWSADTRKRERPLREVVWRTPPLNGDIQVLAEEDLWPIEFHVAGLPLRYYLGMWNEGSFVPMAQFLHDFDVRRHLAGFKRLEEEEGNADPLCGLFRQEGMDRRPLFQRGYCAAFLPYERFVQEMDGSTTMVWGRGYSAGINDRSLHDGWVNTGRKYPCCVEAIEKVQWLL
jgi:hypothetical protein